MKKKDIDLPIGKHTKLKNRQKMIDFLVIYSNNYGNLTKSLKDANISRDKILRQRRVNDVFRQKMDEIDEELLDIAEAALMRRIEDGDTQAIMFFLKTKGKNRGYTQKVDVEVTQTKFVEIQFEELESKVINYEQPKRIQ